MLRQGPIRATYDAFEGNQIHFYRNACLDAQGGKPGGYFYDLDQAIRQAQRFIFIADWSFHPMVCLVRDLKKLQSEGRDHFTNEDTVGYLLAQLANANKRLLIGIHTWNHTDAGAKDTPNDEGDKWLDRLAGGKRPPNLLWRSSSRTRNFMSHHQKFVVLDAPIDPAQPESSRRTVKAFFGGIDITKGRFDMFEHPNLPDDVFTVPLRIPTKIVWREADNTLKRAVFNEWYNAELYSIEPDDAATLKPDLPRESWHDVHGVITGPTAWDVLREFVGRWNARAGGFSDGNNDDAAVQQVMDLYGDLLTDGNFQQQDEGALKAKDAGWKARVLRSIEKDHWGPPPGAMKVRPAALDKFKWPLSDSFERSIQDAYIEAILSADRFIFIETQYLIGSGDRWSQSIGGAGILNGIPEAIVKRTIQKIEAGSDFHTYIVIPMFPEGAPVDKAGQGVPDWQRYFEFQTMKWMAEQVNKAALARGSVWSRYLTFTFPARWEHLRSVENRGTRAERMRANRRYMVYVHSKWIVVDDKVAILGSANLNERSLAGDRDTEICVHMEAKSSAAVEQLRYFRKLLWSEHLKSNASPAFKKLVESVGGTIPPPGDFEPAWDKPESLACISAFTDTAFRNYLYFRRGLRVVVSSWNPNEARQSFMQDGQLMVFPFEFVDSNGIPQSSSQNFAVINTDKLEWLVRTGRFRSTMKTEVGLILKRKVEDGDGSLPDPDVREATAERAPEWQWNCPKPGIVKVMPNTAILISSLAE